MRSRLFKVGDIVTPTTLVGFYCSCNFLRVCTYCFIADKVGIITGKVIGMEDPRGLIKVDYGSGYIDSRFANRFKLSERKPRFYKVI